jgi:hypothetical protein
MGNKELSDRVEKLTGRVTALEKSPARARKGKWDTPVIVATVISSLAILIAAIGLPVTILSFVEPHLQRDLSNDVKLEVASELKELQPQINEMSGNIKEIKGKLEVLDPLIQELITKHFTDAANLTPKELLARLPELKQIVSTAQQGGIKVQPSVIKQVGTKLVDVGAKNTSSWTVAMDFLAYRSLINVEFAPPPFWSVLVPVKDYTVYSAPPTAGPMYNEGRVPIEKAAVYSPLEMKTNVDKTEGDRRLVITGGVIPLDGYQMKHITFKDAKITYRGGKTIMEDVLFINCTFDIVQQAPGQSFARSLLSSAASLDFISS